MSEPLDIAELRGLIAAATLGPWEVIDRGDEDPLVRFPDGEDVSLLTPADAAFIARARTALPAALDELEKSEAARDELARAEKYQFEVIMEFSKRLTKAEARVEKLREALQRIADVADDDAQAWDLIMWSRQALSEGAE